MGKLVLTLEEQDVLNLQEVLLDEDAEGALDFLKTTIAAQIPAKGTAGCDSSRRNPFLMKPDPSE